MFRQSTDLCRGSYLLGDSIVLADLGDSDTADTGVCPVCGKPIELGYALLVPAHARAPLKPA